VLEQLAKMTKYLGLPTLADGLFGVFLLSWIVTRHIFFGLTIKAVALDLPRIAGYRWDPDAGHFLNLPAHLGFCVLLVALQVLLVLWMCMILKVVKRVVMGGSADDVRSDSECVAFAPSGASDARYRDTEDDLEAEIEQIEDRKAFKS
jgi:acyl-CoA-dependent ceramide synthase